MLWVIEDLCRPAALDDLAAVEHDGLVGDLTHDGQVDRGAWTQAYRAVGREEYPHIWRVRDELPLVADDDIFEAVLAIVITGICERAPQPCTCGAHPGGAAAE